MVQMINAFGNKFEKKIEGSGDVDLAALSGGAKIAKVFHERFPFEMVRVESDERSLRKEISFAIKNIHGIRVGLFTPDMAFEAVARKLIEKLKVPLKCPCDPHPGQQVPCQKCVELVAGELNDVIAELGEDMSRFPKCV